MSKKQTQSFPVFWNVDKNGTQEKLKVSQTKLLEFLEYHGFYKMYIKDTNQSMFIRIESNIVNEATPERIKDFVLAFVKGLPSDLPETGHMREELLELLNRGSNQYFGQDKMGHLSPVKPAFHIDDKNTAYFYFCNGFVSVHVNRNEFHTYEKMSGVIWHKQIIQRDHEELDNSEKGEFEQFIENICAGNEDRIRALRTAIGYLLHRHKDRSLAKVIILIDEKISDNPEGRTGKSLIANSVGKARVIALIDGRQFRFDNQFAFQTVNIDTEVICFDDAIEKFDFQKMFHMVTDGLEFEKKHKQRLKFDFKDSPKYIITTNYIIQGEGGSAEARKAEYELSPHYSKDRTPRDEFGHNLFDEWSKEEWVKFDSYMIDCCCLYLTHGLEESKKININQRKLLQATSPEFIAFMDNLLGKNGGFDSGALNHH